MPQIGHASFKESDIASASTCDIGATDEWRLRVTGTTAITSFGTVANRMRFLRFAGVLTLTHDGAALVLPGEANIVTAADDACIALSDGDGNWRVVAYQRWDGRIRTMPGTAANPAVHLGSGAGIYSGGASIQGTIDFSTAAFVINVSNFDIVRTGSQAIAQRVRGENSVSIATERLSTDGISSIMAMRKARGTLAVPEAVALNDFCGVIDFQGYTGASYVNVGRLQVRMTEATPGAGAMGGRWLFLLTPNGSGSAGEIFRIDNESGVGYGGANYFLDQNRLLVNRSATLGTLHTGAAAKQQYASDLGGGANVLVHDSTGWKRFGNGGYEAITSNADANVQALANAVNIRHTGTLTADRAITLQTTNARPGAEIWITRTGSGAFNLNIINGGAGAGTLKALAQDTWAKLVFDGTNWFLAAYGAL